MLVLGKFSRILRILFSLVFCAVVLSSRGVSAQQPIYWPCTDLYNPGGDAMNEFDQESYIDLQGSGMVVDHFEGDIGSCPAGFIQGAYLTYLDKDSVLRLRIASNELRHIFRTSSYIIATYGGDEPDLVSEFSLYVPDNMVENFEDLGFSPIPFSQVEDWSTMMGAAPDDTVAQWIGTFNFGSRHYNGAHLTKMVYALEPGSTNVDFFMAWEPLIKPVLFLPILAR